MKTIRLTTYNITPSSSFGLIFQYKVYSKLIAFLSLKRKNIFVPGVVHAHSALFGGTVARTIAKSFGCNYLVTEHKRSDPNEIIKHESNEYLSIVEFSSYFISLSSAFSMFLKNSYRLAEDKDIVIPNMIPLPFEGEKMSSIVRPYFRFIFIGSLIPLKRPCDLLKAFCRLLKKGYDCELVICGGGGQKNLLQKISSENKVLDKVLIKGVLSRYEILEELKRSNCLCSTSERETFGVGILESISIGVPVIASKSGGPQDIVNKDNGYLFDVGDILQLSILMEQMILNYNNFNHESIRKDAAYRFSRKKISRSIIDLYDEIYCRGAE